MCNQYYYYYNSCDDTGYHHYHCDHQSGREYDHDSCDNDFFHHFNCFNFSKCSHHQPHCESDDGDALNLPKADNAKTNKETTNSTSDEDPNGKTIYTCPRRRDGDSVQQSHREAADSSQLSPNILPVNIYETHDEANNPHIKTTKLHPDFEGPHACPHPRPSL